MVKFLRWALICPKYGDIGGKRTLTFSETVNDDDSSWLDAYDRRMWCQPDAMREHSLLPEHNIVGSHKITPYIKVLGDDLYAFACRRKLFCCRKDAMRAGLINENDMLSLNRLSGQHTPYIRDMWQVMARDGRQACNCVRSRRNNYHARLLR